MEEQGRKLRRLRLIAGLNQFTVARAAGIHRATLSAIENGHIAATAEQVDAIEQACADPAKKAISEIGIFTAATPRKSA